MTILNEDTAARDQWAYDRIAESQTCPVCFAPVAYNATRENRGIVLATYVCGGETEHCWMLKWAAGQGVAA